MSTVLDQISQAEGYKEEGNARFKEANYKKALAAYHKVFCYVNGLQAANERSSASDDAARSTSSNQIPKEKVEDVKRLKHSTHLNMGACYLKLDEHQKCIDACSKALEISSTSKAFFRRGQAYMELRNISGARNDLNRARELSPNNTAVVAELRKLKAASAQVDAKEKKMYGGFLDKASAEPEAPAPEGQPMDTDTTSGPIIEEVVDEKAAGGSLNSGADAGSVESARAVDAAGTAQDDPQAMEEDQAEPPHEEKTQRTIDVDAQDEASRPEVTVRPLTYAWVQTDEEIKIYIPFDQCEELENGVPESAVEVEYGEWNILVVIRSQMDGKAPLGLRLGDFHRRIDPKLSRTAVRSSRITVTLRKREKEHWFNLLQRSG